jgi:hypothetical protein
MTRLPTIATERLRLWIGASHKLAGWAAVGRGNADRGGSGPEIWATAQNVQDLGYVEAAILDIEERLPAIIVRQQKSTGSVEFVPEDAFLSQAYALSRLWIFGLYESVRSYRVAVRGNTTAWEPFKGLSEELNVIRAPLAKQQVAGQARLHVPAPIVAPSTGRVGWQVFDPKKNANRQVLRMELADQFLSAAGELMGTGEWEAAQRSRPQ